MYSMCSRIPICLLAGVAGLWFGSSIVGGVMEVLDARQRDYAYADIRNLTTVAQNYRQFTASYEGVSVKVMSDGGFGLTSFTDGLDENVYGEDISIRSAGADHGRALAAYEFDEEEDCKLFLVFAGDFDEHRERACDGETLRFALE